MTDARLMDADCIHGRVWYECPDCSPTEADLARLPSTPASFYKWIVDDRGKPWVIHQCSEKLDTWQLPPPWRIEGDGIVPSLDCQRCGCHVFVGPLNRATTEEWTAVLEWKLGVILGEAVNDER